VSTRTAIVLAAIRGYREERGYSPSIRDIMQLADISSTSVVVYHLKKLERQGAIRRAPTTARSITLL